MVTLEKNNKTLNYIAMSLFAKNLEHLDRCFRKRLATSSGLYGRAL